MSYQKYKGQSKHEKELVTAGFVFLSLTLPLKVSAFELSQFFVFDDSFSNTGNGLTISEQNSSIGSISPEQSYSQGQFYNNIWVDYLEEEIEWNSTLFANLDTTTPTLANNNDAALATALDELSDISVDFNSLLNEAIAEPEEFEFTNNVNTSCIGSNITNNGVLKECHHANDELFFDEEFRLEEMNTSCVVLTRCHNQNDVDEIHSTTNTHNPVTETVPAETNAKSVPESSTELGILALSAMGAAAMLKRRQKTIRLDFSSKLNS
ncbi:MAG: hypothetical protein HC862_28310 [Scytonema sp. RU_4_4]|nr:hypothetical protein [Scytonema sp. RU_4_4]